MSNMLYRIGRFGARSPWKVIGVWAVLAITVIAASAMFGRELEDSFDAPGVDSAVAAELLESAGAADAGAMPAMVSTISNVVVDGNAITFDRSLETPQGPMQLAYRFTADGDTITGEATSSFGAIPITGTRAADGE